MEWLSTSAAVIGLFVLRLGVPLAAIVGVVWLVRRQERGRWAAALQRLQRATHGRPAPLARPCYEERGCDPAVARKCAGGKACSKAPCFILRRQSDGRLPETCFGCPRYTLAPAIQAQLH